MKQLATNNDSFPTGCLLIAIIVATCLVVLTPIVDYQHLMLHTGNSWYSIFTYQYLHSSVIHAAGNLGGLAVWGIPIERRIGLVWLIIIVTISGVVSGYCWLAFFFQYDPRFMVGLSGSMYTLVGMFVVLRTNQKDVYYYIKRNIGLLGIGYVILVERFVEDNAWQAHVTGALFGMLCGVVYNRLRK